LSAPAECPANAFETLEQYGLSLVEEPALGPFAPPAHAREYAAPPGGLDAFHWSLLAGLATLQLAYLVALARLATWAVHHLIRA
jgi:hypothetical protein